jgi:hypothetical protein
LFIHLPAFESCPTVDGTSAEQSRTVANGAHERAPGSVEPVLFLGCGAGCNGAGARESPVRAAYGAFSQLIDCGIVFSGPGAKTQVRGGGEAPIPWAYS